MNLRHSISWAGALLILGSAAATAQPRDSTRVDSSSGTASAAPIPKRATLDSGTATLPVFVMQKSPTTAVLLSLALPGAGQFYNGQIWKAPLFLAGAGFFLWRALYFNGLYIDKRAEAGQYPIGSVEYSQLRQQRESYRDERDLNYAYTGGVWILGMIDAYVGAHMFDFDVDDDHTSQIYLTPATPGIGLAMRW